MGVAGISNIPNTPETLAQWSFNHMAHHRDINRRIRELDGINLAEYPLDPIDPNNIETFIYQHQQMHNSFNAILGIDGDDLTNVDWRDKGQLSIWIQLNFSEHYRAGIALGV